MFLTLFYYVLLLWFLWESQLSLSWIGLITTIYTIIPTVITTIFLCSITVVVTTVISFSIITTIIRPHYSSKKIVSSVLYTDYSLYTIIHYIIHY